MTEDFLHYVWKFRLFNAAQLHTSSGESITILHPGTHNFHGGPDFLDARLRIGNELWAGHVEIHLKSGDWHAHKHTHDGHYKNVILHAVYDNNVDVFLHQIGDLPVFDLRKFMRVDQWIHYQSWLKNKSFTPCFNQLKDVDQLTWIGWKDRLLVERLIDKKASVMGQLQRTGGDWNEAFYRVLARSFGFKMNADAMEQLAQQLPQSILAKHKSDPFQIESLIFGVAGFLNEVFVDDYPLQMRKEFLYLQQKYKLKLMNAAAWNFGRLRPANFPTIRLAQWAALVCKSEHLFSKLLEQESVAEMRTFFSVVAHEYWDGHYRFDTSERQFRNYKKRLGEDALESVLINAAAPVLFAWGHERKEEAIMTRAIELLASCEVENNHIVRQWKQGGVDASHAGDSQSLIQLYKTYCIPRRCLHCSVGLKMIKGT